MTKEIAISESTALPKELSVSLCTVWSKGHFVRLLDKGPSATDNHCR